MMLSLSLAKQILLPMLAGLAGMFLLAGLYFGIVSWAETPQHAVELFRQDRWIAIPIMIGFGLQAALYAILKKGLFVRASTTGKSGRLMGASGTTSTVAMIACCAHHVTDLLPILGLTAAVTLLAQYRLAFMLAGLSSNLIGIIAMLIILSRERRNAMRAHSISSLLESI